MRLIDADALLDAYENIDWYTVHKTGYMTSGATSSDNPVIHYYDGEEVIKNAPTIDAVPVVRCRECKHHEDEEIGMIYCPNVLGGWVAENWFCADGERKEGVV